MKTFLFATAAAVLHIGSMLHAAFHNPETDQKIVDSVRGAVFSNTVVDYLFDGQTYPIRIINNPKGETLWGNEEFEYPITSRLLMIGDLPYVLYRHLEELIPEIRRDDDSLFIDLRGHHYPEPYVELHPVHIAQSIDDPILDEMATKAFSSTEFANQVLHYYLDGQYYKVRLLHNPQGHTYTARRQYRLELGSPLMWYRITWNHKYGIITDRLAPQNLIDHLSRFTNASYWDWYFNFIVEKGTKVKYWVYRYQNSTTYLLDTWYDFTSDLNEKT